jgi:hypothetical protein
MSDGTPLAIVAEELSTLADVRPPSERVSTRLRPRVIAAWLHRLMPTHTAVEVYTIGPGALFRVIQLPPRRHESGR